MAKHYTGIKNYFLLNKIWKIYSIYYFIKWADWEYSFFLMPLLEFHWAVNRPRLPSQRMFWLPKETKGHASEIKI